MTITNVKSFLFISTNVHWGGSELLWSKTAIELAKGHKVTVCYPDRLELPIWLKKQEHISFIAVSNIKPVFYKRLANKMLPYRLRYKAKDPYRPLMDKIKPDLIIVNQGYNFNGVDIMGLALELRIPYTSISQAINELYWPDNGLRIKMKKVFKKALINFFVSTANLEVTKSQLTIDLNNSKIVRNPFNVPYNTPPSYPSADVFNLACVGRYDINAKGQDILLRTLSQEKWRSRNLKFNFYGSGKDLVNIKELREYHQLNNVEIHPYTKTIDIWKQNHGLILPSRYEGLPIAEVEAMLCNRIVIVTDVSGNTELVSEGINGFIAEAPQVHYLDAALERAWAQRKNWKELGENAGKAIRMSVPENPGLEMAEIIVALLNP